MFSITFTQPSLLLTFFCIKPLRMDTASLLSQTGYSTSSWRIDSNKSSSLSAFKKVLFNLALKKLSSHLKRGLPCHHLIHQDSKRPPVHAGAIVKLLLSQKSLIWFDQKCCDTDLKYLWGNIVRSATKCWCCRSVPYSLLTHTKVRNFHVALLKY